MTFLFTILMLGGLVAMMVWQHRRVGLAETKYQGFRAGQMASRLGLSLVEGDPMFNLMVQQANPSVNRRLTDRSPLDVRIRMAGAPFGTPLQFAYVHRVEQDTGWTEVTRSSWFDCNLSAPVNRQFPPFEVMSRRPPLGPITSIAGLPPMSTGAHQVDQAFQVTTRDPAMARYLGELLGAFLSFENAGVHLVGDGSSIAFYMQRDRAPLLANTLFHAEHLSHVISHTAARLGA